MLVPHRDIIELDMDVESAIKLVVSLGVVVPPWSPPAEAAALAPPGPAP
jgi:uncharacterized membrane protein